MNAKIKFEINNHEITDHDDKLSRYIDVKKSGGVRSIKLEAEFPVGSEVEGTDEFKNLMKSIKDLAKLINP